MRLFAPLKGGQCQVPPYSGHFPQGKQQELFLCCLCADSSTEEPLNTFPFQPLLLHFKQISAEYLLVSVTGPMYLSKLTASMWHQSRPHPTHPTSCMLKPQIHQRSSILSESLPETPLWSLQSLSPSLYGESQSSCISD